MIIGLIVGTGVNEEELLSESYESRIETKYGEVSYLRGFISSKEAILIKRHGKNHSLPPHKINYRANMLAMYELGIERIITTSAVGAIKEYIKPGSFVLIKDFLDFTKQRPPTIFEDNVVKHTDFTEPYCPELNSIIEREMKKLKFDYFKDEVYVSTEGPRFETPQEIKLYKGFGGSVVGMTGVPEVVFARELRICYTTIAIATNFASGISNTPLTHEEVVEEMKKTSDKLTVILKNVLPLIPVERNCKCANE